MSIQINRWCLRQKEPNIFCNFFNMLKKRNRSSPYCHIDNKASGDEENAVLRAGFPVVAAFFAAFIRGGRYEQSQDYRRI
jgi:hypothetical protein